jgi:hypothetical protein
MVKKFLLPLLIAGALLWPADSPRTKTPDQPRFYQAVMVKGQPDVLPAFDTGFDYGQWWPHFNPYGPGHLEGPFPRDHKHHKHRSYDV